MTTTRTTNWKDVAGMAALGMVRIWQHAAYQTMLLSFCGYFLAGGLFHVWLRPQASTPWVLSVFEWLCILNSLLFVWQAYRKFRFARH
jgi:ABC-type multidrug transport system permease subunit